MVDIAAEKGVTLTVDEVKGFLKQMDEDSEFDDIELDPIALAAIAGGQEKWALLPEEAHDELNGVVAPACVRCQGKWLFGRSRQTRTLQATRLHPTEQKVELYQQFVANPAGIRIIELAAAEALQLDKAEVSELIKAIDIEEEFDDVELDAVALAAVAGGRRGGGARC